MMMSDENEAKNKSVCSMQVVFDFFKADSTTFVQTTKTLSHQRISAI
jgi:hypothetical protein